MFLIRIGDVRGLPRRRSIRREQLMHAHSGRQRWPRGGREASSLSCGREI